uniref:Uncharacterized protein n=1 Tax=Physcomitrium patens TaxID=3218 RepID=A0A7I4EHK0_PHYPA
MHNVGFPGLVSITVVGITHAGNTCLPNCPLRCIPS